MTNRGAGAKRTPVTPPRKPLWRRLNRHGLFVLHVIVYLIVGTWIWTLNAPALDKQFDVLLWLTVVCGHGLAVYRNQRIAFLLHLLMFSAGNGAIWSTTAATADKLTVMLAWVFVAGLVGLWLARRQLAARTLSPTPPQRKSRTRKAPAPPSEPEWYEPPANAGWDDTPADEGWYDPPADQPDDTAEIEPPPKKRGRKKSSGG